LVDADTKLLLQSLFTLLVGTIGVMLTAFIIGVLHRGILITNEIMARTAPNLMDLMVALSAPSDVLMGDMKDILHHHEPDRWV